MRENKSNNCPLDHARLIWGGGAAGAAAGAGICRRAPRFLFYGLSAGKPEELSTLILSLESTCQDLFATGYFESDISDDLLTPADGETLLQWVSITREAREHGHQTDVRRTGKWENWKRHLDPRLTSWVSVFRSSLTEK